MSQNSGTIAWIVDYKGKGKLHPITGHEVPDVEL